MPNRHPWSYMEAFLCNTEAQTLFLCFPSFFYSILHQKEKKNASMTNIISGILHFRTDIWGNNGLVDNGTSLHGVLHIWQAGWVNSSCYSLNRWLKYFEQYTDRKERINYLCRDTFFSPTVIHVNIFVKIRGIETISQIFSHCLTITHNGKMSIHSPSIIVINRLSLLLSYRHWKLSLNSLEDSKCELAG